MNKIYKRLFYSVILTICFSSLPIWGAESMLTARRGEEGGDRGGYHNEYNRGNQYHPEGNMNNEERRAVVPVPNYNNGNNNTPTEIIVPQNSNQAPPQ